MKLYASYTSPFARHCRIALLESGLECEFVETTHAQSAESSSTKKVPFLVDGDVKLTDSASILQYFADKSDYSFIENAQELELFSMATTCLDSVINVFLLEMDGVTDEASGYIKRQKGRIVSSLEELDAKMANRTNATLSTGEIRLACLLEFGVFRNRISLDGLNNLTALLTAANKEENFKATAIPA